MTGAAMTRREIRHGLHLLICVLTLVPPVFSGETEFETEVRPLLIRKCGECHGAKVRKSDLRLDARQPAMKGGSGGPVILPGRSGDSELIRRITSETAEERMPPDGEALTPQEVDLLKRWIDAGALWPETDYDRTAMADPRLSHWSFQPLLPVAVPEGTGHPVDWFLRTRLSAAGLTPNLPADRLTRIRRATLDITGLPPERDRVDAFLADDSPDAWSTLVDELLASSGYGERWAQHWLDVVRYADTHGFEVNTPRENAWPYRDYVIRSLNENKPYDQFVREQLAGDYYQQDAATGFLVASAVLLPGQIGADDESKRLARQDALDEMIVCTGSTLLGLTIGCARCHEHKFDPISQQDYYALQACFAGVEYGERPIQDAETEQRRQKLADISKELERLQATVQAAQPEVFTGRTLLLNEDDRAVTSWLRKENGPGQNPPGIQKGYRDDPGAVDRFSNLSGGHYTWWDNSPGQDVMTWNPGVAGEFRLWLSWGVHGSGVHTRDARYLLDHDGNPETTSDQQSLAVVDQYYPAGVSSGETEKVPQWSGLLPIGPVRLQTASRIILRCGETGTGITADAVVLQEMVDSNHAWPLLRAPVSPLKNIERFPPTQARFVRFTTFETVSQNLHEPCLDEFEVYGIAAPSRNLALSECGTRASSSGNYSETGIHQLKHINDGQYGNSWSWISSQRGGGWVQLEFPELQQIDTIVWSRDREGKFADRLPVRYHISVSADGQHWQTVVRNDDRVPHGMPFDAFQAAMRRQAVEGHRNAADAVRRLAALEAEKQSLQKPRMVFAGTFREPDQTFVLRRGDPEQRVSEVQPAIPAVFTQLPTLPSGQVHNSQTHSHRPADTSDSQLTVSQATPEQQRRIRLADWIASPANPLTARVIVNRVWQGHFGRGIVETPSDFGLNGIPPVHPELLDWLAGELIRSGWSLKHLHRLIMTSETYQQSAVASPDAVHLDRDNQLLSRFTSRRLEAEAMRDCILAVTGELNREMGGPGFSLFGSRGGLDGFPPREEFSPQELRRMIYAHKVRMEPVPVFGAFDCPDAGQSMPRRSRSTTAIQALNLFNSPFLAQRAESFAARLQRECGEDPAACIREAWRLTCGRTPTPEESSRAQTTVQQHGLVVLCRVLLNSSEFLFLP